MTIKLEPMLFRKLFLSSLFIFFIASQTISQDRVRVSGRVIDDSTGTPIPGVNVVLKGDAKTGTATAADGTFSLQAPLNGTLVISSLGYAEREIGINNRQNVEITLVSRSTELSDVVVIGYGSRQKKDLTGAVSVVTAKDIEKSTSMTPELALQGRTPGVFVSSGGGEPGQRPTIRIRGTNTFGYADPLYVVDGVPIYEGGGTTMSGATGDIRSPLNIFALINPADIESMSVLKDASAAAIYGVRASNGVILITTKRGRSGRPRVELNSSYAIQNLPKTKKMLNTQQYFELMRESYANFPDPGVSFETKFGPRYTTGNPLYAGNSPTYDWQKELLNKNAPIHDHNVRVSGGSENINYYFSGGYSKTESPLKANDLERYSIATNLDARVSKIVQAGLNVRLVQSNALDNTNGSLEDMMSTLPFQPFYDASDPTGFAPSAVATGPLIANPDYDPTALSPGAPFIFASDPAMLWGEQTRYNVFALQALNKRTYKLLNALGNAFVQVEPFKGLRIKGTLGGSYYFSFRRIFTNNEQWRFTQPAGAPFSATQDQFAKGQLGERNTRTVNLNKEITVNYTKTFNTDHSIDIVLGASQQFTRWDISDLSGQVNYVDPQYWNIGNRPPNTNGFSSILEEDALIGYVGRVSYKYQDRYYLDATLRRDGSSRLAPGHRFDNFPSIGLGWRISQEKFFPQAKFINDLKIRGGWGRLGNYQSAQYYAYLSNVSGTPDFGFGSGSGNGVGIVVPAAALPGFPNFDLTWEKVREINVGFDATLLGNRVTLTAEYYNKTTFDVIQNVPLPPNTGIQESASLNVAKVRNQGVEVQLGYNNRFGEVNFNASANITTVKNRVLKLNNGAPFGGGGGFVEEGKPMFYLYGYKVGGIFQSQAEIDAWRAQHADGTIGQDPDDATAGYAYQPGDMYFQDLHGSPRNKGERFSPTPDGVVNDNDRTYLGKTIPGYFYGFSFGADWRGIDISVLFQGVGDVQRYNGIRAGLESMGSLANQFATTLNRWRPGNPSTEIPRAAWGDPANSTRFSSRFVENAGFLRMKNVQVGYSIPKSLLGKTGFIQNFRIYASGINLVTFTNWSGLDPEADSGAGPNGINIIPPTRQFQFGVNATF